MPPPPTHRASPLRSGAFGVNAALHAAAAMDPDGPIGFPAPPPPCPVRFGPKAPAPAPAPASEVMREGHGRARADAATASPSASSPPAARVKPESSVVQAHEVSRGGAPSAAGGSGAPRAAVGARRAAKEEPQVVVQPRPSDAGEHVIVGVCDADWSEPAQVVAVTESAEDHPGASGTVIAQPIPKLKPTPTASKANSKANTKAKAKAKPKAKPKAKRKPKKVKKKKKNVATEPTAPGVPSLRQRLNMRKIESGKEELIAAKLEIEQKEADLALWAAAGFPATVYNDGIQDFDEYSEREFWALHEFKVKFIKDHPKAKKVKMKNAARAFRDSWAAQELEARRLAAKAIIACKSATTYSQAEVVVLDDDSPADVIADSEKSPGPATAHAAEAIVEAIDSVPRNVPRNAHPPSPAPAASRLRSDSSDEIALQARGVAGGMVGKKRMKSEARDVESSAAPEMSASMPKRRKRQAANVAGSSAPASCSTG